jgi:hypothetical protein
LNTSAQILFDLFNHDTVLKHGLICAINKVMFFFIFLLVSNDVYTVLCDLKKLAQTLNIYTLMEMLERVMYEDWVCCSNLCTSLISKLGLNGLSWMVMEMFTALYLVMIIVILGWRIDRRNLEVLQYCWFLLKFILSNLKMIFLPKI